MKTIDVLPAAKFNPKKPEPGFYTGVDDQVYFRSSALNHSLLKLIEQSPLHMRMAQLNPDHSAQSEAQALGTLQHLAAFEPHRLRNVIGPPLNTSKDPKTGMPRNTPYGRETKAYEEFAAQNPGKIIATPEELTNAVEVVKAIKEHPKLAPLFGPQTLKETVVIWEEDGLLFKAKLDIISPHGIICDLKTTANASERKFASSIADYYYYTQAAMYLRAMKAHGYEDFSYIIGAVEIETRQVVSYPIDGKFLRIGRILLGDWINKAKKCHAESEWPGYTQELVYIEPPMWLLSQFSSDDM